MAKLEITFQGDYLSSGFFLRATAGIVEDVPEECVLLQRGSETQPERLVRIANPDEMALPVAPVLHDIFKSAY